MNKILTRQSLLGIILSLRLIPLRWIYSLGDRDPENKKSIYNLVTTAKNEKLIDVKEGMTGSKYVILTRKGLERFDGTKFIHRYRPWNRLQKLQGLRMSDHHYLIFEFLVEYYRKFGGFDVMYSDYDKECKLECTSIGKTYFIRPDLLIEPTESDIQKLVVLEADTNLESQKVIFDKLLKYFLVSMLYNKVSNIDSIEIYFLFKSKKRLETIFSEGDAGIVSLFSFMNTPISSKLRTSVRIKDIMRILDTGMIKIYAGSGGESIDEYKEIPIFEMLKKKNGLWANYK